MKSPQNTRSIRYYNKEDIKIRNVKLQFYNNLIILYLPCFIKIYDIKRK